MEYGNPNVIKLPNSNSNVCMYGNPNVIKLSKFKFKGVAKSINFAYGRCKRSKLQTQGCKSTELHMKGCKRSNLHSRVQKLWMAH